MDLEKVEVYLKKYAGIHYKKAIDVNDPMNQLALQGKQAREAFVQLVKEVEPYFPGYTFLPCSNWVKMNQIASNYFWVQMKKEGYNDCLSSISLVAKKVGDSVYFYIAVEIKGDDADSGELDRHNKILDMPLEDDRLYYSEGDNIYFNLGQNREQAQELLQHKQLKKVRLQLDIEDAFNNATTEYMLAATVEGIQTLLPYYIAILSKQTTRQRQQNWTIICNPKKYDVIGAFKQLDTIEWKQSTNVLVGDIIYIYVSTPYKEIKYKCQALKVNLTKITIDDSAFVLDGSNYINYDRYMELKLIKTYPDGTFPYKLLKEHELSSVQGPSKVTPMLSKYLSIQEIVLYPEIQEREIVEDSLLTKNLNTHPIETQPPTTSYERKKKVVKDGIKVYPRDRGVALRALSKANYSCEIDSEHPTFMRRNADIPYTEPHHLIPLAFTELFEVSLDIEENIVSLCSNCHNQLHYGKDAKILLSRLYSERKKVLNKVDIYISIEELFSMYGLE